MRERGRERGFKNSKESSVYLTVEEERTSVGKSGDSLSFQEVFCFVFHVSCSC